MYVEAEIQHILHALKMVFWLKQNNTLNLMWSIRLDFEFLKVLENLLGKKMLRQKLLPGLIVVGSITLGLEHNPAIRQNSRNRVGNDHMFKYLTSLQLGIYKKESYIFNYLKLFFKIPTHQQAVPHNTTVTKVSTCVLWDVNLATMCFQTAKSQGNWKHSDESATCPLPD